MSISNLITIAIVILLLDSVLIVFIILRMIRMNESFKVANQNFRGINSDLYNHKKNIEFLLKANEKTKYSASEYFESILKTLETPKAKKKTLYKIPVKVKPLKKSKPKKKNKK